VRHTNNFVLRHTALNQIVFHEFRDPGVGPQAAPAGYNHRRFALAEEFRSTSRAVGKEVVVAQNDDSVCFVERIFDDPRVCSPAHQRMAHEIQPKAEDSQENEHDQIDEDAAALPSAFRSSFAAGLRPHQAFGSSARSSVAAASGETALKYTSLML